MLTRKRGTATNGLGFCAYRGALRRSLLPMLLLAGIATAGCVTDSDMDSMRSNLAQNQAMSTNRDRELTRMKEQIATMQRDVNSLTAIKESQSNILSQTSDYSKELQALRGRFDENKYFMDKSIKDLTSEVELQKARITALENQLRDGKPKAASENNDTAKPAVEAAAPPAKAAETKAPDNAAKLYDEAHIAYKGKKYADARKKFERFNKEYPKENLTPNSFFWIGESYYAEKKYEDAILAYEDYLKKYPNHEKVKGAMLKQGYSFLALGDKKTGKVILESLIEKYPKSNEAEQAREKLKKLSSAKTPASKSKKKN
ncbi:MAG TPA: tol-pal system protein YbgF [Dissulfurispiraceae bacterium]|nr:tol-pal system protein YbgF [Dissulfurispiraceae bacterium]